MELIRVNWKCCDDDAGAALRSALSCEPGSRLARPRQASLRH